MVSGFGLYVMNLINIIAFSVEKTITRQQVFYLLFYLIIIMFFVLCIDCESFKNWLLKCRDDSETAHYITSNTKDVCLCFLSFPIFYFFIFLFFYLFIFLF